MPPEMTMTTDGPDVEVCQPVPSVALPGLHACRELWIKQQPKKPKPLIKDLQRDLEHGWLMPFLFQLDGLIWKRWEYWAQCQMNIGELPQHPIPEIDFCGHGDDAAHGRQMLETALNGITNYGSWMGWSSSTHLHYFFDWLLYGFGHEGHRELPEEPGGCEGASMRLYQLFDLAPLLLWPYDHLADIIAETGYGKGQGFFPTPMNVCLMMAQMVMGEGDHRMKTVCDPCVGTGRMPLAASNRSLRLYAQDVDLLMCKATLINGYLYAPWLAVPIFWLDNVTVRAGNSLSMEPGTPMNGWRDEPAAPDAKAVEVLEQRSEAMTAQAPPHYQQTLFETEFDASGTRETFPVLKRRKRSTPRTERAEQMSLMEVDHV